MEQRAERFVTISDLVYALVQAPVDGNEWIEANLPRPGDHLGRFEIVREIGRGGHGVVFEARDLALGRLVALKSVPRGRAEADPARVEALHREAEAMASLHHTNIVTLYDYVTSSSGPYLVLELLGGEPLSARLSRGPLALGEAVRIASDVARALVHSHERGVLHRDLKPGNVSLGPRGEVKVLDFSFASTRGRARTGGGTPGYMAPEQLEGRPEDARTDVYALGLLLVHMITGEPPLPPERRGEPARIPQLEARTLPFLVLLLESALARDPAHRPDAAEFLLGLEEVARRLKARRWTRRIAQRFARTASRAGGALAAGAAASL